MTIAKKFKEFIKKFFLIEDTPHKVAAGAALGIFLGITPGEGVITTLIIVSILRFNRLAAMAGVLAFNMWTTLFILPLAAAVGAFLFHTDTRDLIQNFHTTYHLGLEYFLSKIILLDLVLPLAAGFIIVAGAISIVFYFLLYYLLKYHKIRFK